MIDTYNRKHASPEYCIRTTIPNTTSKNIVLYKQPNRPQGWNGIWLPPSACVLMDEFLEGTYNSTNKLNLVVTTENNKGQTEQDSLSKQQQAIHCCSETRWYNNEWQSNPKLCFTGYSLTSETWCFAVCCGVTMDIRPQQPDRSTSANCKMLLPSSKKSILLYLVKVKSFKIKLNICKIVSIMVVPNKYSRKIYSVVNLMTPTLYHKYWYFRVTFRMCTIFRIERVQTNSKNPC